MNQNQNKKLSLLAVVLNLLYSGHNCTAWAVLLVFVGLSILGAASAIDLGNWKPAVGRLGVILPVLGVCFFPIAICIDKKFAMPKRWRWKNWLRAPGYKFLIRTFPRDAWVERLLLFRERQHEVYSGEGRTPEAVNDPQYVNVNTFSAALDKGIAGKIVMDGERTFHSRVYKNDKMVRAADFVFNFDGKPWRLRVVIVQDVPAGNQNALHDRLINEIAAIDGVEQVQ